MKKIIIIATLSLIYCFNVMAQDPDHTFSYQGELIDNGVPANGDYDIIIDAYLTETGVVTSGSTSTHLMVNVENGLFSLKNVNIGDIPFDGKELWLNIAVRESGGVGFTDLSPRQLLHAVPYAAKLTSGFATNGQVYTYDDSFGWNPADLPTSSSPWTESGSNISYTSGNVGVGTTNPLQDFVVNGTTNGDVMRVNVDGSSKFLVDDNGGVGIGSLSTPPVNGLDVEGDVKQPITSNGVMKYMVHAICGNGVSSAIEKSYNGVGSGTISITSAIQAGRCTITFPDDISNRYMQVSPLFGVPGRAASCRFSGTNDLQCIRYDPSTLSGINGEIMILVY